MKTQKALIFLSAFPTFGGGNCHHPSLLATFFSCDVPVYYTLIARSRRSRHATACLIDIAIYRLTARTWPWAISPRSSIWPRLHNRSTFRAGGNWGDYPQEKIEAGKIHDETLEGAFHVLNFNFPCSFHPLAAWDSRSTTKNLERNFLSF